MFTDGWSFIAPWRKQAEVLDALLGTGTLPGFVDEDAEEDDSLAAQRQRRMS